MGSFTTCPGCEGLPLHFVSLAIHLPLFLGGRQIIPGSPQQPENQEEQYEEEEQSPPKIAHGVFPPERNRRSAAAHSTISGITSFAHGNRLLEKNSPHHCGLFSKSSKKGITKVSRHHFEHKENSPQKMMAGWAGYLLCVWRGSLMHPIVANYLTENNIDRKSPEACRPARFAEALARRAGRESPLGLLTSKPPVPLRNLRPAVRFLQSTRNFKTALWAASKFVSPEGIEPPSAGSKPATLSIKLRGRNFLNIPPKLPLCKPQKVSIFNVFWGYLLTFCLPSASMGVQLNSNGRNMLYPREGVFC